MDQMDRQMAGWMNESVGKQLDGQVIRLEGGEGWEEWMNEHRHKLHMSNQWLSVVLDGTMGIPIISATQYYCCLLTIY